MRSRGIDGARRPRRNKALPGRTGQGHHLTRSRASATQAGRQASAQGLKCQSLSRVSEGRKDPSRSPDRTGGPSRPTLFPWASLGAHTRDQPEGRRAEGAAMAGHGGGCCLLPPERLQTSTQPQPPTPISFPSRPFSPMKQKPKTDCRGEVVNATGTKAGVHVHSNVGRAGASPEPEQHTWPLEVSCHWAETGDLLTRSAHCDIRWRLTAMGQGRGVRGDRNAESPTHQTQVPSAGRGQQSSPMCSCHQPRPHPGSSTSAGGAREGGDPARAGRRQG